MCHFVSGTTLRRVSYVLHTVFRRHTDIQVVGRLEQDRGCPVCVTHESAESKGEETVAAASTTQEADASTEDQEGRENGWVGQARPPTTIVTENEVLPRRTSFTNTYRQHECRYVCAFRCMLLRTTRLLPAFATRFFSFPCFDTIGWIQRLFGVKYHGFLAGRISFLVTQPIMSGLLSDQV